MLKARGLRIGSGQASAGTRPASSGPDNNVSRLVGIAAVIVTVAASMGAKPAKTVAPDPCPGRDSTITTRPGFCVTVFADQVGHARHMVVAPNGTVYVNTWSGTYYTGPQLQAPFLIALRDTKGTGHADVNQRFGPTPAQGGTGGTGIALYHGFLYAEAGDKIVRYRLFSGAPVPASAEQTVVSGLPTTGDHPMHSIAIDSAGGLYIDLGSATNSCQTKNRTENVPGAQPCTELETRAGIWRYEANTLNQAFSAAGRYVTGIRNAVGIAVAADGKTVFATQHGRDQLHDNWPKLYTVEQQRDEPAEELVRLERGADYGWPECYFDGLQGGSGKLVLAPEYAGDGGHAVGVCASKRAPEAWFPAHYAPDGLAFYTGKTFPASYDGGVFIAFHGSWNRAPLPQAGYNVVFQPFSAGHPAGAYEVFLDGFAAGHLDPQFAAHRPTGVAVGPDGALYVSDDKGGRIWKVTFVGGR